MTPPKRNLLGFEFTRLTVIGFAGRRAHSKPYWWCRCVCGIELAVDAQNLINGNTKSCGCLWKDRIVESNATHGRSGTDIYQIHWHMIERCTNPNTWSYPRYGGRGITVCERWLGKDGFANFLADVGERPSKKHTLDRINNDLGYFPANVRWATHIEQSRNKTSTIRVEWNGETVPLIALCEQYDKKMSAVRDRLRRGMSVYDALFSERKRRPANNNAKDYKYGEVVALCKEIGVEPNLVYSRLRNGWAINDALNKPSQRTSINARR